MTRGASEALDGRFLIEEASARHGGIGTIHRGRDLTTGEAVAIKVLRQTSGAEIARFVREAELLAGLAHPAIVRHVAHGFSPDGEPYLVMDWLVGESLADRLGRQLLTADETLVLARRVADALAFAHARGLVHRDIKPANILLVGGDVAQSTIIDFGVARPSVVQAELTDAGTMVGTLGYMAPEQARGEPDVGPPADVFALGCVLYKCVAGRAPFVGDNLTAVLAKTLFEDAPRLRDTCDGVPAALDHLVARMLAKDPKRRPASGAALVLELDALCEAPLETRFTSGPPSERTRAYAHAGITSGEQSLVSVILATAPHTGPAEDTLRAAPPLPTLDPEGKLPALRAVVAHFGAHLDPLANGLVVATLSGTASATDQAAQAARCALAMARELGHANVVLATGRGVLGGRLPVGFAIDRAVKLLRHDRRARARSGERGATLVDEVTAGLLDTRFETRARGDGAFELVQERETPDVVRTLLGKPTPFVGRSRELGVLTAVLDACLSEPAAQCVLVTGAAGIGKSRLRYEFLRVVRKRPEPLEIWTARGEPIVAGSPLRLLSHALRSALGIVDHEGLAGSRQRLRTRASRHLAPADAARVSEFLGELVGVPFPDESSVQLRAARKDAVLRGDQMRRAFYDFIEAECAARPIVLVLEDLHWGDLATLEMVESAVRRLRDLPLMVVGLGRSEVRELFPKVFAKAPLTRLEVAELSARASEKLVRDVLGSDVAPPVVARLVQRAEGNAFFLEELIRAVAQRAEGTPASAGGGRSCASDDDPLPETVVAVVQARLAHLQPDERRVLRAASIFGEVFHDEGVVTILGGPTGRTTAATMLDRLIASELVTRRPKSRFHGAVEHVFRHAHVREAAYASLTDQDRALGHRLAGEWLEGAGEHDAFALAEHFERGGAHARAAHWYRRAAEQALEANDLGVALARAERGARGASAGTLGPLHLLEAEVHGWRGEHVEALERGEQAMAWLEHGSDLWLEAAGHVAEACGRLGQNDRLERLGERLCALKFDEPGANQVTACVRAATQAMFAGKFELGARLTAAVETARARFVDLEPAVVAWIDYARSVRALFAGELGENVRLKAAVVSGFEQAGDQRNACIQRVRLGYGWIVLGVHGEGERALREALAAAQRMGLAKVSALARHNLGLALARRGALSEARTLEADALAAFEAQGDRRLAGACHMYLASIETARGDLAAAEEHARNAVAAHENNPPILAEALATLAWVRLASGRNGEALDAARRASELLDVLGRVEDAEPLIRLAFARALHAAGDDTAARVAITDAKRRLEERAARIGDAVLRRHFLEDEPENRHTLELARAWCVA